MAHTTCGSEKPTEESTRERDLGASVGRDSLFLSQITILTSKIGVRRPFFEKLRFTYFHAIR